MGRLKLVVGSQLW